MYINTHILRSSSSRDTKISIIPFVTIAPCLTVFDHNNTRFIAVYNQSQVALFGKNK
jgi:hypothetical protein